MNARIELLDEIKDREVKYVHIKFDNYHKEIVISGTLADVLPLLNFDYDNGYGSQELFGNIWYTDGTWSEREEYDGSECWSHKQCPEIPDIQSRKG